MEQELTVHRTVLSMCSRHEASDELNISNQRAGGGEGSGGKYSFGLSLSLSLSLSLPLPWENPALHSDGGLVLWLGHVTASLTNERRLLWFKRKQRQVSVGTVGSKPCRLTHVLQAWAANNKITSFLRNVDSALWENKLGSALGRNLFLTENLWKRFTISFHLLTLGN